MKEDIIDLFNEFRYDFGIFIGAIRGADKMAWIGAGIFIMIMAVIAFS